MTTVIEKNVTDLPGDKEITLKLKNRTQQELIAFQRKLTQPRYQNDPQGMAIRFHLIRELLDRTLTKVPDMPELNDTSLYR